MCIQRCKMGMVQSFAGRPGHRIILLSLRACSALQINTRPAANGSDTAKVPEAPSTPPPTQKVGTLHKEDLST